MHGPILNRKARVRYKTHKIARRATALAQRCTSWCREPRAYVRTLGTNPRCIMCLLDGVLIGIQAPRWVVHQRLLFSSSFSSSGASNHAPLTMGIAVALLSIAIAIPLRWRRMMARLKARDLFHRFGWSSANWVDNNVADAYGHSAGAINLRRDSMTSAGAKRVMSFCLI